MGTGSPKSLAEFIEESRAVGGPCKYVRSTTPAQRADIAAHITPGFIRWTAISKWLRTQDVDLGPYNIRNHFDKNHSDDE